MYIIKNLTPSEINSIKEGNKTLLKKKLEQQLKMWDDLLHLSKEDHRFNQGVCCTLLDMIELL